MFTLQSPTTLPPLNGAINRDRAIVATLLYYDLFSFPLRADELVRFAHGITSSSTKGQSNGHIQPDDLPRRAEWWESNETFWFLKGREHLVQRRTELSRVSIEKLARARKYARLLQLIPGVRTVGITGSLAMASARPEDDIDFLVIAARDRLWLTRALVLSALLAWGVKRPDDGRAEFPNLICANIFLSESDLHIPDHNLFIAHEICQTLPLLGERGYRQILDANAWVRDYLPQWKPTPIELEDRAGFRRAQRAFELAFYNSIGNKLDRELGQRQLKRIEAKHARGHNTNVKITPTQLRFHARDLSDYVINSFNTRWNELNLHPISNL